MKPFQIIEVTAFIDWRAQMYNCGMSEEPNALLAAIRTLTLTSRVLSRTLVAQNQAARYRVSLRLYHGWTKGYSWTINRRAIHDAVTEVDFSTLSKSSNVVINPIVAYGDLLISALPLRITQPRQIHLPGTLRDNDSAGRVREKMVDTALAADLLSLARSDPEDWSIVLGEDDDLIPPIFVAEVWKKQSDGKVFLLRNREEKHSKVNLDGLLIKGVWK